MVASLKVLREAAKKNSQTRSKPLKTPPNHPENRPFWPNFTFRPPKSHKNPGVGGWVNRFGRDLPKKKVFFLAAPLNCLELKTWMHCWTTHREVGCSRWKTSPPRGRWRTWCSSRANNLGKHHSQWNLLGIGFFGQKWTSVLKIYYYYLLCYMVGLGRSGSWVGQVCG